MHAGSCTLPNDHATQNLTTLSLATRTLDLPDLGPESPLPSVAAKLESPYIAKTEGQDDMAARAAWGNVENLFPYQQQDSYSRTTHPTELSAVVLENNKIRAVFLPELGGRLWELTDKATGKALLHTPDRVQFANLALRNAWFAGGIEYNIGTRGHSPTTASPLHAAVVRTPEGQEILRMWEFDRLREVVFQIDAWLPEDSSVVFVAVRIRNPNAHTVPMYWWSNAAVPLEANSRVIAPAADAYATDYDGSMALVQPADFHGIDATWPARNTHAADFFFDLAPDQRRWVVNADHDGDGLALLSSAQLRGRKLFVWGESVGGHHWQEWLSPSTADGSAQRYAEIQAGLAQTQFEHVPMAAGESWQWVEAYGNAALNPERSHSADWAVAADEAEFGVAALVGSEVIDGALSDAARWADLPPDLFVVHSNGWGALEAARRRASGTGWIDETGTPFTPETLGPEQAPWLALLRGAASFSGAKFCGAESFVRGADWERLLERAGGSSGNAHAAFHLATMAHARGDLKAAVVLYESALGWAALPDSAHALADRGLGLARLALAGQGSFQPDAVVRGLANLREACATDPASRWLLAEAMQLHIQHGCPEDALDLAHHAPAWWQALGRIQFLNALAHARAGDPGIAAGILREGIEVPDLREGEDSLTALWQEVCPGEPVPVRYQFSMK